MTAEEAFVLLYEPLKKVTVEAGYALAVHGSLRRDIDLIAIPWRPKITPPLFFLASFVKKIQELNKFCLVIGPHRQPHGRFSYSIYLGEAGGEPYIDLSIYTRQAPR